VSDIDTVVVDSLKALDPNRPIREADIAPLNSRNEGFGILVPRLIAQSSLTPIDLTSGVQRATSLSMKR
jgi:hypothetical protein